jgi:hypothetical protein
MRANAALTRITCAGVVDADAYDVSEIELLERKGIAILPVSEIENLFLLPSVTEAIARIEGYDGDDLNTKLNSISDELFAQAADSKTQLPIVMRYCRRRIDRTLKKIDLSDASDVAALTSDYIAKTSALDIAALASLASDNIQKSVSEKNVGDLLKWYDNKGLLGIACKAKNTTKVLFEQWIVRAMMNKSAPLLSDAIRRVLPIVSAV